MILGRARGRRQRTDGTIVLPVMVRSLRMSAIGLASMTLVVTACAEGPGRDDGGSAQDRRVQIVEMIKSGDLTDPDADGWIALPEDLAEASSARRGVRVWTDPALTVFFLTQTFLGPDPYCGYEYTEAADPIEDPLHSGSGKELEAIGDGWYWLCAS